MGKVKEYFKNSKQVLSDLFFVIPSLITLVFIYFEQQYEINIDPSLVNFPLWLMIGLFAISFSLYVIHFILEGKTKKIPHWYVSLFFVVLLVFGLVGIFIAPKDFSITFINNGGTTILLEFEISNIHRIFFAFERVLLLCLIYSGLFIMPKRLKSKGIIIVGCSLVLLLCVLALTYSYIVEYDHYGLVLENIAKRYIWGAYYWAPVSFLVHRNGFGMALLLGISATIVLHGVTKKWWWSFVIIYLFISMLFTICKTAILLATILIIVYFFYYLVSTYKHRRLLKKSLLIALSFSVVVTGYLVFLSYVTEGKFLGFINDVIEVYEEGSGTLKSRTYIWNNVIQLLAENKGLYLTFGRGYGLVNEMVKHMNFYNGDSAFSIHNSYLALVGQSGLLYPVSFVCFFIYVTIISFKNFRKTHHEIVPMLLCLFTYVGYSMVETIHPLCYIFMFFILIVYNTNKNKIEVTNE